MAQTAEIAAVLVAALNLIVALAGGWCWWQGLSPAAFWRGWRVAQLGTTALAAVALIALLSGFDPDDGLFWLYMALPIAVAIIAEQLRIATAQYVLDQRGLEDAQAVGRLPADEQQRVVDAIMSREALIVVTAAGVIVFLALRVLVTV